MEPVVRELRAVQDMHDVLGFDFFSAHAPPQERRAHPRTKWTGLPGAVWIADRKTVVEVVDVSLSGARVRDCSTAGVGLGIHDGSHVVFALYPEPYKAIIVACTVVRIADREVGLRFLTLTHEQQDELERQLSSMGQAESPKAGERSDAARWRDKIRTPWTVW